MIVSFYDKDFNGLLNNASLRVDNDSYKLIKRPVELNELTCTCEAFTEDINPTFLVISDARGRYVYGSLAGVPVLNSKNKTEINGTDIKSMLSSEVTLHTISSDYFGIVNEAIDYIFDQWDREVNQGSFKYKLIYTKDVGYVYIKDLVPFYPFGKYNVLEELQSLLRYYKLYLDTKLDLVNGEIQFIIGRTMLEPVDVKLWEYGVKNYGKWIADVNECQGYFVETKDGAENWLIVDNDGVPTIKWILTASGNVTTDPNKRDIYPIKRKIVSSSESMTDANMLALETLLESQYNEDIELQATDIKPTFETRFDVYVTRGSAEPYKKLPCGELQYDTSGLVKFKIGYRYTGVNFI